VQAGLVDGEIIMGETEDHHKTYAVKSAVDTRLKKLVHFKDAVSRRLLDKETGRFKDTLNNSYLPISEAINKGFVKARVITEEEAHSLDVDPDNKFIIDKTIAIKKKVLVPLGAISAMKKAAQDS